MSESLYLVGWLFSAIGIYMHKTKKSRVEYFIDVIPSVLYGMVWPIVAFLMITAFSPFIINFQQDKIDKLEQKLRTLETVLLLNGLLINDPCIEATNRVQTNPPASSKT